jgi:hypothetical protein
MSARGNLSQVPYGHEEMAVIRMRPIWKREIHLPDRGDAPNDGPTIINGGCHREDTR